MAYSLGMEPSDVGSEPREASNAVIRVFHGTCFRGLISMIDMKTKTV